ncbi:MAG: MFS transporter [Fretibacterium sp.]|nr:MFS transporter [Fretibacterium sp.]
MSSQVVSMTGIWVQRMTTVWLVLSVTDSPFLSSVNDFASQFPVLVLGLFSGAVVDRIDKRRLIQVTQFMLMILALSMAVLTFTHKATYLLILLISVCLGTVNAFDMPARQACISLMVDRPDYLTNAIALNSAVFNLSRVIGPTVAGFVVAAVGEGYCFLFTGLAFIAPITALHLMRLRPHIPDAERPGVITAIREGLSYVKNNRHIKITLLMVCTVSFFGMPIYVTFSALVKMVLKAEASLFGLILGGVGLGALVATIRIASLPNIKGFPRRLFWTLFCLGGGITAVGVTKIPLLLVPMSLPVGWGLVYSMTGCNTMLQTFISDKMRGRVMSLYTMALSGAAPLGSLVTGVIMDKIGIVAAILFQGIACLIAAFMYMRYINILDNSVQSLYGDETLLGDS